MGADTFEENARENARRLAALDPLNYREIRVAWIEQNPKQLCTDTVLRPRELLDVIPAHTNSLEIAPVDKHGQIVNYYMHLSNLQVRAFLDELHHLSSAPEKSPPYKPETVEILVMDESGAVQGRPRVIPSIDEREVVEYLGFSDKYALKPSFEDQPPERGNTYTIYRWSIF